MESPDLLGSEFQGPTWGAWKAVLKALYGLPMSKRELGIFKEVSGRGKPPSAPVTEAWLACGRRAGKSRIVALMAVFAACFRDHSAYLVPGERAVVMVMATDRRQAQIVLGYVRGLLAACPMLQAMVVNEGREAIELSNGITIEIHTASYRAVRGVTIICCIMDECAYWRDDNFANPDSEIINAVRPGMATVPGAMLLGIGSPYRRQGAMYDAHQEHYGRDDSDVLFVKAPTKMLNSTISQAVIAKAYRDDPQRAASEYGAEFRSDIAAALDEAWLQAATVPGRHELPYRKGHSYVAFTDPSGGRGDAFTLAIAHEEDGRRMLDLLHSVAPPFDPSVVITQFAKTLSAYKLGETHGDNYAAEFTVEAFANCGVRYIRSTRPKSEIYAEILPLFATGSIDLLDNQNLLNELRRLERRTRAGGKDVFDHPPIGHDDAANSACGALLLAGNAGVEVTPDMYQLAPNAFLDALDYDNLI